jgi:hypothetical protein
LSTQITFKLRPGAHLTLFRMTGVMLDRNAEFIPPDRQIAQPEWNKFRVPEM